MKLNKRNLVIYILGLAISLLLLGLYFIDTDNPWCILSCSIGASGIGAVVLAFFIELSNEKTKEENRKIVRNSKLYTIEHRAIRLLERIVVYYFKRRTLINGNKSSKECHKITFDELWDELSAQEEYCEQLISNGRKDVLINTHSGSESIKKYCKSMSDHIGNKISEIRLFEAVGYFNNEETAVIANAGVFCHDVSTFAFALDVESLNMFYRALINVNELEFLRTMTFYYKNKRIDFISSKHKFLLREKISKEDMEAAISSVERMKETLLINS